MLTYLKEDNFFRDLSVPHQKLAEEVRMLIFSIIPELKESIKYGIPFYSLNRKNLFYFSVQKGKLFLCLVYGAKLESGVNVQKATDRKCRKHRINLQS